MKIKELLGFSCALCLFFLAVVSAYGQDRNFRVSVSGGGSFLKADRTFRVGGDVLRTTDDNGAKIEFRGTADLREHWGAEFTYGYGKNNLHVTKLSGTGLGERVFDVRVHHFSANALYFLNPASDKFRIFGTAGLGIARFSPTDDAKTAAVRSFIEQPAFLNSDNKLDFNFGGGVEAKLGSWYGARFDFRDHLTRIPRYGVPQAAASGDFFPVSGAVHNVVLTAGVVVYLGRR